MALVDFNFIIIPFSFDVNLRGIPRTFQDKQSLKPVGDCVLAPGQFKVN